VLRVREGGEVTDTVELDAGLHAYAVALAGEDARTLVICTSASHDPAEIAANPTAKMRVVKF
jgi:hypothetical protein